MELGKVDSPAMVHEWVESIEDPQDRQLGMQAVADAYSSDELFGLLYFLEDNEEGLFSENEI